MENSSNQRGKSSKGCSCGIRSFIATYFVIVGCRMMQGVYFTAVARTLERRFGLRTRTLGMVSAVNDIILICLVLFVGHFGKRFHIPRVLSGASILLAISALCMALPYFIYGPLKLQTGFSSDDVLDINTTKRASVISAINQTSDHLCTPAENNLFSKASCSLPTNESWAAIIWFVLAEIFSGFATSAINILGMSYIDLNTPKVKLPLYLGFLNSVYAIAPLIAFPMSAVIMKFPEAIFTSEVPQSDPRWIACWWLGFIIVAFIEIICAIPMFQFPRHMANSEHRNEDTEEDANTSLIINNTNKHSLKVAIKDDITSIPASTKKLLKRRPLVVMLAVNVTAIYIVFAYYANLPRYLEVHFRQPASTASMQAGLILAGASAAGVIISGLLMNRTKMTLPATAMMAAIVTLIMMSGLAIDTFISCPSSQMAGLTPKNKYVPVLGCSANCSCITDRRTYQPVCGSDGLTYYSPCHAGCSATYYNSTYGDCQCSEKSSSKAYKGSCDEPCPTSITIYNAVSFVAIFFGSMMEVPRAVLLLRLIPDEQKSFGLGISSFCLNLFGFIPAPILIGHLIDSTCILWQLVCEVSGACLLYNTNSLRYLIHGATVVVLVLTSGLFLIVYFLLLNESRTEANNNVRSFGISDKSNRNKKVERNDSVKTQRLSTV